MATSDDERTVDEQGRVTIPEEMREELGIEPGEEVDVELQGETVVIRPQISREGHSHGKLSREEFIELMEGCITEDTVREDAEEIDPLELKNMWTSDLSGE